MDVNPPKYPFDKGGTKGNRSIQIKGLLNGGR